MKSTLSLNKILDIDNIVLFNFCSTVLCGTLACLDGCQIVIVHDTLWIILSGTWSASLLQ